MSELVTRLQAYSTRREKRKTSPHSFAAAPLSRYPESRIELQKDLADSDSWKSCAREFKRRRESVDMYEKGGGKISLQRNAPMVALLENICHPGRR